MKGGGVIARALAVLGATTVGVVMFLPGGHAVAQAPDVAAWWNSANLGDPVPAPPAPPDVPSGDLYVSGSNAGPAGLLGNAPTTTQAVAGVAFDLAKGALVTGLTLQIDGSAPPQVSVIACQAKEPFTSAENAPWSQVPTYDANACVPSELKGTSVVFADVGKLATPGALRVLILPGPLDRIVFKQPTNSTLTVSSGGSVGAGAPPVGSGTGSTPSPASAPATVPNSGSAGSGSGSGAVVPPVGDLPATDSTSAPVAQPPVVAQPGTTPTAAQPATTTGSGMSTKERRLIGLLIIAAEVLGYVLLRRWPGRDVASTAGVAVAGGRLRPPDRVASGMRSSQSGGVGRFRRDREGAVPHL